MDSQLLAATESFFKALAANQPPLKLLAYFSTTNPVSIQHVPRTCPHPHASRLHGLNAVRSYFDLLATHWERTAIKQHKTSVDTDTYSVTTIATITWRWKKSGRSWNEDISCTLEFDENLRICHLLVTTESDTSTCVMRAVDSDTPTNTSSSKSPPTPATPASSSIVEVVSVSIPIPLPRSRPHSRATSSPADPCISSVICRFSSFVNNDEASDQKTRAIHNSISTNRSLERLCSASATLPARTLAITLSFYSFSWIRISETPSCVLTRTHAQSRPRLANIVPDRLKPLALSAPVYIFSHPPYLL